MKLLRAGAILACACTLAMVGAGDAPDGLGPAGEAHASPQEKREKQRQRAKLRKRPNVILVVSDDQTLAQYRPETMPFVTGSLGGNGTTFTNAFATSPVCCPSPASMLTGQYPHNHGVLSNVSGYKSLQGKRSTLPVWLAEKGYATAHVGKYLNGYAKFIDRKKERAPGWKEWHTTLDNRYYDYDFVSNGRVSERGSAEGDYLGRVITKKATKTVNRYVPRRRPLYMQVDYYAPHTQGGGEDDCGGAARPDPADKDLFADEPLSQPPSYDEADVDDKPTFIRRLPNLDAEEVDNVTRRHRCALASLRSIDRGIEQIADAVAARGELDKTAIIFTSDNGYFYGEHRLPKEKQQAYEEGIRVPLVARWPEKLGATPATISHPVANIDLAPTILRLAKARPCRSPKGGKRARKRCRTMDGRSLLPLARGDLSKFPSDRVLAIEYDNVKDFQSRGSTCAFDGVRTPFDMYVEHRRVVADPDAEFCEKTNEEEQYLLEEDPSYGPVNADPFQLRNLTSPAIPDSLMPQVIARRAELRELLDELRDCAGIPGRDKAPKSGHYCQ